MRTGPIRLLALLKLSACSVCLTAGACGGAPERPPSDPAASPTAASPSATSNPTGFSSTPSGDRQASPVAARVGDTEIRRDALIERIGPRDEKESEANYERRIHDHLLKVTLDAVLAGAAVLGGAAPVPEPMPTTEDALRLFQLHPSAFEEKAAVKFGVFFILPDDLLEDGKRTYDEASAEARLRMASLLSDHAQGEPAAAVATRYGLGERGWRSSKDWEWRHASKQTRAAEPFIDWAFDPARSPGERKVFEARNGLVVGVAIYEVRPARSRTFEEAGEDVTSLIRRFRAAKLRLHHRLRVLDSVAVHPSSLTEELERATREELQRYEDDPVWRDIETR